MRRIALAAVLVTACGRPAAPEGRTPGQVRVKAPAELTAELLARGFDPDHERGGGAVYGFFSESDYAALPWSVERRLVDAPEAPITAALREGYHDYPALTAELQRLQSAYPAMVRLETAGRSVQGRELWYLVISKDVAQDQDKPAFIYHANMHGDEVVGRELMIYLTRHLLQSYGTDARITQLLDNVTLYVMPSMNPDGYELGRRENARGVDLNRNLPDRFSSPSDTPAGRQLEVQHMIRLGQAHHFVYGINWHGGEICFNLPWGNVSNARAEDRYGDDALFNPIGREYTRLNRSMYANHHDNFDHGLTYGYEWYPVNGGINDWFNHYRRSVHAVVELTTTKWPAASTLPRHWDDNREAMLTYLWRGLRGVHLDVRDEQGTAVGPFTVKLASAPKRPLQFDGPRAHRLTADGRQTVTVEAAGYEPATVEVEASYLAGDWTAVVLRKRAAL